MQMETLKLHSRDHSVVDVLDQVATWNASMLLCDDCAQALAAVRRRTQ